MLKQFVTGKATCKHLVKYERDEALLLIYTDVSCVNLSGFTRIFYR